MLESLGEKIFLLPATDTLHLPAFENVEVNATAIAGVGVVIGEMIHRG